MQKIGFQDEGPDNPLSVPSLSTAVQAERSRAGRLWKRRRPPSSTTRCSRPALAPERNAIIPRSRPQQKPEDYVTEAPCGVSLYRPGMTGLMIPAGEGAPDTPLLLARCTEGAPRPGKLHPLRMWPYDRAIIDVHSALRGIRKRGRMPELIVTRNRRRYVCACCSNNQGRTRCAPSLLAFS
jgi:hypothetical protein